MSGLTKRIRSRIRTRLGAELPDAERGRNYVLRRREVPSIKVHDLGHRVWRGKRVHLRESYEVSDGTWVSDETYFVPDPNYFEDWYVPPEQDSGEGKPPYCCQERDVSTFFNSEGLREVRKTRIHPWNGPDWGDEFGTEFGTTYDDIEVYDPPGSIRPSIRRRVFVETGVEE